MPPLLTPWIKVSAFYPLAVSCSRAFLRCSMVGFGVSALLLLGLCGVRLLTRSYAVGHVCVLFRVSPFACWILAVLFLLA